MVLLVCWGCGGGGGSPPTPSPPDTSQPNLEVRLQPVRLMVIDDDALAAAVERGWSSRSSQPIVVTRLTRAAWREVLNAPYEQGLETDAVVFPPEDLGELVARNWLLPLPEFVKEEASFADGDYAEGDIYMSVRRGVLAWGDGAWLVPFSSGQTLLALGTPAKLGVAEETAENPASTWKTPLTWSELHRLAEEWSHSSVASSDSSANGAAPSPVPAPSTPTKVLGQPLGPGWGARMLLLRAAAYVKEPGRYADLFELGTLRPLIAEEPYLRALRELLADQEFAPAESLTWSPGDVFREVRAGNLRIGVAALVTSSAVLPPQVKEAEWSLAAIPGAAEVYQFSDHRWVRLDEPRNVPLLGGLGSVGGVAKGTRRQRAAWSVLVGITGRRWGGDMCGAGQAGTPFRISQWKAAGNWLPAGLDDRIAREQQAGMRSLWERSTFFSVPRIPSAAEYLRILDDHVRAAARGEMKPEDALNATVQGWQAVTERIGKDRQAKALLQHHGL